MTNSKHLGDTNDFIFECFSSLRIGHIALSLRQSFQKDYNCYYNKYAHVQVLCLHSVRIRINVFFYMQ